MTKADFVVLKQAVEELHDCEATYVTSQHVRESLEGRPVWDGMVTVFGVTGHPAADTCYAWSAEDPETGRITVHAVLHYAPIQSSRDAVRTVLASKQWVEG
jgi:hypothetical protein